MRLEPCRDPYRRRSWDFVKLLLIVYITSAGAENLKQGHNICKGRNMSRNRLKIDRVGKPNTKGRMVKGPPVEWDIRIQNRL